MSDNTFRMNYWIYLKGGTNCTAVGNQPSSRDRNRLIYCFGPLLSVSASKRLRWNNTIG